MVELADDADIVPVPLQPGIHAAVAVAVALAAVVGGQSSVDVDLDLLTEEIFHEVIADLRQLPLAH